MRQPPQRLVRPGHVCGVHGAKLAIKVVQQLCEVVLPLHASDRCADESRHRWGPALLDRTANRDDLLVREAHRDLLSHTRIIPRVVQTPPCRAGHFSRSRAEILWGYAKNARLGGGGRRHHRPCGGRVEPEGSAAVLRGLYLAAYSRFPLKVL